MTYRSLVQLAGLSMRWPSFRSLKSSSTGIPGYGEPPNVKISHMSTPNDHLIKYQIHILILTSFSSCGIFHDFFLNTTQSWSCLVNDTVVCSRSTFTMLTMMNSQHKRLRWITYCRNQLQLCKLKWEMNCASLSESQILSHSCHWGVTIITIIIQY